jgi:F-type H+-transporting ATPase subunit a
VSPSFVLAATISINNNATAKFLGFTVDTTDLLSTAVAGLIVIGLGLWMAHKVTTGVPGKLQLAYETIVSATSRQVEENIGPAGKPIVPLAVTLFLFILMANELEMIPTQFGSHPELLPPPTADVNLCYALAIFVILLVHAASIRSRGLKGYLGHYFRPYKALLPLNILEEIAKPATLALRLFGNVFAGGLMLVLIAGLFPTSWIVPIPLFDVVWKLFDGLLIFPIQAFIFSLLTILYFEAAMSRSSH